ncbi:MAG: trimethylamine methyltransferase family protein [Chloroflexota bacterium]
MSTSLRVLSVEDRHQVHERTLKLLSGTGVRVDSSRACDILAAAGAEVDSQSGRVRLPVPLIENCLRAAPKEFSLGGRRPGWSLDLPSGDSALLVDGGAIFTYEAQVRQRRPATRDDWLIATLISDALDDFGGYWSIVEGCFGESPGDIVAYWAAIFRHFSKHVQESTATPEQTRWMLEVLQIVFGSREQVRASLPVSFLLCPTSPLIIEAEYTDAYLEAVGWGLPAAVMPMPLLGLTGPGTLISNLILCNCETLAMLCLVQAAAPGTPFLFAPAPAIADPRSGRFIGGEVEHALMGAAVTEMARYYELPVESSAGGSDQQVPGIQAGYERALNYVLPILSQPDLLVGPGLLGGSMTFSPEQLVIDLEIVRRCKRLSRGIDTNEEEWLDRIIAGVEPGGNFLVQPSTRRALRSGELYLGQFGLHETYERWEADGKPNLLEIARQQVAQIISSHQPLPLDEVTQRALALLEKSARTVTNR